MATPTIHIAHDTETEIATATIIFLSDGTTATIASTAPNYKAVVAAITLNNADEDEVKALIRPTLTVGKSLKALSERVRYDEGNIYFDGDPIDNSLAKHIVRIIGEGGDENAYKALVNFMEKLYSNPSEKSRDSLYDFLLRQDITILPNGDFIAYKGLRKDATSIHAGYGIVDGVAFQHANLVNNIGSTIEIPRSKVDDDTSRGCSTGLHAGSYKYASDFARGMLVTVQINPRDVVSVPDDCNFQKIRTSRYVVLAQTEVEYKQTTWTAAEDDDWAADDEDEATTYCETCGSETDSLDENGECEDCGDQYAEDEATVRRDATEKGIDIDALAQQAAAARTELSDADVLDIIVTISDNAPKAQAPVDDEFTQHITNKPTPEDFEEQLQREFADEADIVLNFDYTYAYGETKAVEGFRPRETANKAEGLLITGKNAEDQWRSYYYCHMANITVRHDGSQARHAAE